MAENREVGTWRDDQGARAGRGNTARRGRVAQVLAVVLLPGWLGPGAEPAQERDGAAIIRHIDESTHIRYDTILGYTVREHYAVFRGADQTHPAAEMTVKTTYKKGAGKSYTIVSRSGSGVIQRFGLQPLLDHEQAINQPDKVEKSWFVSANYEMRVKPGVTRRVEGRDCVAVAIDPKRKAPNMIEGTLWVDRRDDSVAEVEGIASQAPSIFAGRTHMMRWYENMNGFAMATHARAESDSHFFGKTVVTIDYQDYKFEIRPAAGH